MSAKSSDKPLAHAALVLGEQHAA
jgi:hypothetical protein